MNQPLVSIIVPTLNSSKFLEDCLQSIRNQTYTKIELIVVDRNSTDSTKEIAKIYTDKVFNKEPERSVQRNYGVQMSSGEYVAIIDSDMRLSPSVIDECVKKISEKSTVLGIIIPEESFGEGFWAQCKKLERSFYVGVPWMEAARFFRKSAYVEVGGYDEDMVSGEDWDLSQRIACRGEIDRIENFIFHNEGKISLLKTVMKKFYYAQKFVQYTKKNEGGESRKNQTSIVKRYWLFFSQPMKLLRNPLLGVGVLFMKTCEFGFGAIGYFLKKLSWNV